MWHISTLIFIFSQLASTDPIQINFHLTDSLCPTDQPTRHHCLDVPAQISDEKTPREIISYCLTECPSPSAINSNHSPFTFRQLAQQKITTHHLHSWSASIDLIERYQHFLDRHHSDSDVDDDVSFYNCTWPRFGPACQYTFDHLQSSESYASLSALIHDYYSKNQYTPTTFTCYEHLTCHRGPAPTCLDWSEICDGKVDCADGDRDEAECWRLEVNECEEDEYRCLNGQCIHRRFHFDETKLIECVDSSDEGYGSHHGTNCDSNEPIMDCEDTVCLHYQSLSELPVANTCGHNRRRLFAETLFSVQPAHLSDACWLALICRASSETAPTTHCENRCLSSGCGTPIAQHCRHNQSLYFLPAVPVLFGHLYLLYTQQQLKGPAEIVEPDFICLDSQFCNFIPIDNTTLQINNLTCRSAKSTSFPSHPSLPFDWLQRYPWAAYQTYSQCAALSDNYFRLCDNHDHLYRCTNTSKCISRHRLLDGTPDCFFADDEQMDIVGQLIDLANDTAFFRCSSSYTFISHRLVGNGNCDCPHDGSYICDDELSEKKYIETHIAFQTICDGFTDLKPVMVDGRWMTDETGCEEWLCDNVYTRCDKIWNCLDGRDEVNCNRTLVHTQCPADSRSCLLRETNEVICLGLEKVNDGHVDCLGATDEPLICRSNTTTVYVKLDHFYCRGDYVNYPCLHMLELCAEIPHCKTGDDQQFCRRGKKGKVIPFDCPPSDISTMTPAEEHFCERFSLAGKRSIVHFSISDDISDLHQPPLVKTNQLFPSPHISQRKTPSDNQCHRGLTLRLWSASPSIACLCPPSYYGSHCQFQNQRISLTLQFRALSDAWQTTFVIVILLVDHTHHRHIHSAQQLTYLPSRDCQIKFNLNLLFATRPSNASLNHSIHFDIYEQHSHHHRASYLAPIIFPFLPVYRLALQLDIPRLHTHRSCSDLDCGRHGRCLRYARVFHSPSAWPSSFCECEEGWSGRHCTIPISCTCSPRARCLGTLMGSNRSICLCPPGRHGPRCYLSNDHLCQGNTTHPPCLNGGQCTPSESKYTCICPRGFTGERCQHTQTQLIISFDPRVVKQLSSSMLVHFIRSYPDRRHDNGTTVKSIPFNFAPVSVFWPHPFHVVFVEFHHHHYYLAFVQPTFNQSEVKMETMIRAVDRCPHIRELLSPAIARSHLLYRIKSYHSLCRQKIMCFYDGVHFCLCQPSPRNGEGRREANCLEYDHGRKFDCLGQNGCENGGQCFQDNPTCPQTSVCMCGACSYGRRCQFTMDGFRLSLDAILGYHIQPHIPLRQQPSLVHVALGLTMVMSMLGIMNGVLSLITFTSKKLCEVGCGYYLLGSSVTTLLTMAILLAKFAILLSSQMGLLTDVAFLAVQCRVVDYLLRVCLNLDQWLNACVSLERAITVLQGAHFKKSRSRTQARYVIILLVLIMLGSTIYDPIHRRLIDDRMNNDNDEDDRIWCVVSYPKVLKTVDSVIHMLHFCIPFFINLHFGSDHHLAECSIPSNITDDADVSTDPHRSTSTAQAHSDWSHCDHHPQCPPVNFGRCLWMHEVEQ